MTDEMSTPIVIDDTRLIDAVQPLKQQDTEIQKNISYLMCIASIMEQWEY